MDRRAMLRTLAGGGAALVGVGVALVIPGGAVQDQADDCTDRETLGITRSAIRRTGFRDCIYCSGAGAVLDGVDNSPSGPWARFKRCPACERRRSALA